MKLPFLGQAEAKARERAERAESRGWSPSDQCRSGLSETGVLGKPCFMPDMQSYKPDHQIHLLLPLPQFPSWMLAGCIAAWLAAAGLSSDWWEMNKCVKGNFQEMSLERETFISLSFCRQKHPHDGWDRSNHPGLWGNILRMTEQQERKSPGLTWSWSLSTSPRSALSNFLYVRMQ